MTSGNKTSVLVKSHILDYGFKNLIMMTLYYYSIDTVVDSVLILQVTQSLW